MSQVAGRANRAPGLGYWGDVVDNARDVAARRDVHEVAEVMHLLRMALEPVENVEAELQREKQLQLPDADGKLTEQVG